MSNITKLNSSTEIFPIESPNKTFRPKVILNSKKIKSSSYMMDPFIIPRVKQYINETKNSKYPLDIDEMADELQSKYKEYSRRKRNAFKACVHKAFNYVMKEAGNGDDEVYSSDELDSDNDIDVGSVQGKASAALLNMYLKNASNLRKKSGGEKELINISSDEDEKERPPRPVAPPPTITVGHLSDITVTPSSAAISGLSRKRKNGEPFLMRVKKREKQCQAPKASFDNFAGLNDAIIKNVLELAYQVIIPDVIEQLGTLPPPGFLIYGPHGSGKTFFVRCLAGELQLPLITASELIGGISGESERRIRNLFDEAEANAPCILFLDDLDSLAAPKEQSQREMSRRIVTQLKKCIDELGPGVVVAGAACHADSIDAGLRRPGRLALEVSLGMPNRDQREEILKVVFQGYKLDPEIKLSKIAELTPGFVACDLQSLAYESCKSTFYRAFGDRCLKKEGKNYHCLSAEKFKESVKPEEIDSLYITQKDIESSLNLIQPSGLREGFTTVPDVTWDDIGSLGAIRNTIHHQIIEPIRNPILYAHMGLSTPGGLLLCGPPGCGKTLLAKAVANQSGLNFISVKGPELLNMYLGESEKAVRQVFERARNSSPCVIFFDEIDALCPIRGNSSHDASTRLVTTMLTEMDGLVARKDVFVLAATNRPELVDPAILRPGRLDKTIFVGLPKAEDRADILKALTRKKPPLESDVDLVEIAQDSRTEGYSGADLAALVKEAASNALTDLFTEHGYQIFKEDLPKVKKEHFYRAFGKIKPSVSEKSIKYFEKMEQSFGTNLCDAPLFKETQVDSDISKKLENEPCESNENEKKEEESSEPKEDIKDDIEEKMDTND